MALTDKNDAIGIIALYHIDFVAVNRENITH